MTTRIGAIVVALSFLTGMCGAQMSSASSRVAIVGDSGSANLADLVVANLTNETSISLLERQDMMKVGDELHLEQLAGSNATSLGRMLNADGLLFIRKVPEGFDVRLTSVGLGYALFDDSLTVDANSDLPHIAQVIAQRTVDYSSKLSLKPEAAVLISVLNIRADTASDEGVSLEKKLSLLLESSLASQPSYVVLERRHARALLFEKSLAPSVEQAPLEGAYVVDGSFTQSLQGGNDLAVHLRLRSPTSQENPLEIQGSSKDLRALTDQMTAAIQKAIGKPVLPVAWQPAKEAREYLIEGIWGWQHGAIDEALEALDSAAMLGETAPDLEAARIHVLSAKAVGSTNITNAFPDTPDDPHPEARIEAILRAFDEVEKFEASGAHQPLQILGNDVMSGMITQYRPTVNKAGGSLLVMLDRTNNPEADEVRSKLCDSLRFDPFHGEFPAEIQTTILYLDDIAHTPDEEIAFVHKLFDAPNNYCWVSWQQQTNPDNFCARFVPDVSKRHAMYLQFLQQMEQDGRARPIAFVERLNRSEQLNLNQDDELRRCTDELWNERQNLLGDGRLSILLSEVFGAADAEKEVNAGLDDGEKRDAKKLAPPSPRLIDLMHFLLQNSRGIDSNINEAWQPQYFPATEAPKFWNDLQVLASKPPLGGSEGYLASMRSRYIIRWGLPQANAAPAAVVASTVDSGAAPNNAAPAGALVVNRFWYPKDAADAGPFSLEHTRHSPLGFDASGVWVTVTVGGDDQPLKSALYHVGIDATQGNPFTTAPAIEPPVDTDGIVVTSDALYILGSPINQWDVTLMARYDLSSQQWDQHDVPYSRDLYLAAGHLYLSLRGQGVSPEGGIALYDEKTAATTLLASSRRRPPQNQFDDRNSLDVRNIFSGPGNKPCATIGFGETYVIKDSPGNWSRMIDSGQTEYAKSDGTRTLIYGPRNESDKSLGDVVFMVDPARDQPELLRGAPVASWGTSMQGKLAPPPAPWPVPAVWPDPAGSSYSYDEYGFRGNDIYARLSDEPPRNGLFWYRRGQARPVYIPLDFKPGDDVMNLFQKILSATRPEQQQFLKIPTSGGTMEMGRTGIFFINYDLGFYYLPYADIDAYLKTHPEGAPAPPPQMPVVHPTKRPFIPYFSTPNN